MTTTRAAAAPSSSAAGAPALRALRRFFIFAQLAGHTFLLERRFAVQRCSVAVAAVCNSFEPLATSATEECVGRVDKPPRVIKLQNFSRLAEACARQSSARSKTGIFRHTKSWRDESVSCGFRQPNHKIDFLGPITARRALICDARVILAKRSSDLLHLTAREPRVSTLQSASRKSAAHAAARSHGRLQPELPATTATAIPATK